ncbi:TetR family transcriptional regulator [Streptomyces sp. NPDC005955]|uniref:TetR/AcrR family transcriptional regulator n=1 Tax=Streptomyces sp. NPDC005955 TaxID=3364738 RepID=UPI0036D04284
MPATAPPPSPVDPSQLGLRERKKLKTRVAIREATYRLIAEQGYEATTVEQIAQAAEVSASTVFRYFPTKEDIVLTDEHDPVMEEALRNRPAEEPLLDSLRHVLRQTMEHSMRHEPEVTKLRMRLMAEVPAVRSRSLESMSVTGGMLCRVIAERTGRDPAELEVRAYAMGLVGTLFETSRYWAERDYPDDIGDLLDRALTVFAQGLGPGVARANQGGPTGR